MVDVIIPKNLQMRVFNVVPTTIHIPSEENFQYGQTIILKSKPHMLKLILKNEFGFEKHWGGVWVGKPTFLYCVALKT